MDAWLERLEREGHLRVIEEPCDVDLEIAHAAYLEVKKPD
ncbi:hypothetical protein, partial [Hydrogenimonas sp.]